jgi:hypothetical protein
MELNATQLQEKWNPVLEASDAGTITDAYKRSVTAIVLENQEKALNETRMAAGGTDATGAINNWDPVMISLVRRSTPNLLAFDIAGVQPMTGPTGLIFAMKSNYSDGTAGADGISGNADDVAPTEALFNEPNTSFSGKAGGARMTTLEAEGNNYNEMGFSIEKQVVEAESRQLRAQYTMELAQDLKAVHGLNAETELANILSSEILGEINREMIKKINAQAVAFTAFDATPVTGTSKGRWEVEVFKSLITHFEKAANAIAIATRRGKGNFAIISSGVAAALNATGSVQYGNVATTGLADVNGNLFIGTLNGGIKLYVDPFAATDYVTVGYKGTNAYDAGMFYCPYVPLSMMKTIGENDFQPKIGFKTRYGVTHNPFTSGVDGANTYYQTFAVTNL